MDADTDTDLWLRIETDTGIVDVVDTCAAALQALDIEVDRRDDVLVLRDTGIALSPAGLEVERTERRWRSSSIVVVEGPGALAGGLFEYQHNVGDTVEAALRSGFTQWAKLDLPPLLDVVSHSSARCTHLELKLPVDGVERVRRIVLGPVLCFQQQQSATTTTTATATTTTPPPAAKKPGFFARLFKRAPVEAPVPAVVTAVDDAPDDAPADDDKHDPFCPCCMTTRLLIADVLKPLLADDGTFGVRLFASRDDDGSVVADVRFNGHDSDDGITVLKQYATTWPRRGLEYRKQYAVIYTPPLDN